MLGHTYRAAANELSAHIPRKVIRGWNGQGREDFGVVEIVGGRNVLVVGHITLLWYVENVPPTGPAVILASLIGTAPSTFAALPNLGRITRPFTMPATRPTGLIRSVFRYRLQLAPFTADHRWVPESLTTTTGTPGPLRDHFSSHAATLAPETLDGDTLVGQSVMILP